MGTRGTEVAATLIAALGTLVLLIALTPLPATAATPRTVISFTADDGSVSQTVGADILAEHGMRGTFYVVSGSIDTPGYLSRADLHRLAASGHEIGGHTTNHPDLTRTAPDEARRQVCQDRSTLMRWGLRVTSFTAPFGRTDAATDRIVAECGYNSSRLSGLLRSPEGCAQCSPAESLPVRDPYRIRAVGTMSRGYTLSALQRMVLDAEASGGGWVPIVLHRTCDFCGPQSISPAVLGHFADWLAARESRGTTVRTVDQVVGGEVRALGSVPEPALHERVLNSSLEEQGRSGSPRGWAVSGWGTNTPVWTRTRDAHSGRWAQHLDLVDHVDGDAKLMPRPDLGESAPAAEPGSTYTLGAWYKSTVDSQIAVHYRTAAGSWVYWTSSPPFPRSAQWQQATWTTPPLPPEATALSFGLALYSAGSLTTDDYSLNVDKDSTGETCALQTWWNPLRWLC